MLTQETAAVLIQKQWRDFATKRKNATDDAIILASALGRRLDSFDEVIECMSENKIFIQIHGGSADMMSRHSCFYMDNARHHLKLMDQEEIELEKPRYISKYPYNKNYYAAIAEYDDTGMDKVNLHFRLRYICQKKYLYVLDDKYEKYFECAFYDEAIHFSRSPYSFGLHYNCHQFVRNVLRRTANLAIRFQLLCNNT